MRVRTALGAFLALALLSPVPADGQTRPVGIIHGTVALPPMPKRKTAPRYPAGGVATKSMQDVPAVVYLTGVSLGDQRVTATVAMAQRDTVFAPGALVVQVGSVVRFPNEDPFFHNVFSYASNARFDLGRYPGGESREVRFDEAGIASVYCEVHASMRAVVVVTDNPFHAVVRPDGTFRIEGVPEGEYTLVVYHPDLGSEEERVVVSDGRVVNLQLVLGR